LGERGKEEKKERKRETAMQDENMLSGSLPALDGIPFLDMLDVCGWQGENLSSFLSKEVTEFVDWDSFLKMKEWDEERLIQMWSNSYRDAHPREVDLLLVLLSSIARDDPDVLVSALCLFPRMMTKFGFAQGEKKASLWATGREDGLGATVWVVREGDADEESLNKVGFQVRVFDLLEGIVSGNVTQIGREEVEAIKIHCHADRCLLTPQSLREL